ncbi:MAG: response regulator transcription factor [Clostridia bacterium]|nr:response regulator transcription factor [Clostridia bacterium]
MKKIKLIIVEDDHNWIIAMKLFLDLEQDIDVVAVATTYDEAVKTCIENNADLVLMDISLSANELDGIYAAAEILAHKDIKIIMLTALADSSIIENAFAAGAVNYVLKSNYRSIPTVIRQTLNSLTPNEILARDYSRLRKKEIQSDLTSQEENIFQKLIEGKTKDEILEASFISENTLKNHIHSILKKLEVKTIKEAIHKVKRKGFIRDTNHIKY